MVLSGVVVTTALSSSRRLLAAPLTLPHLAWVGFATALNVGIWVLS